MDLGTRLLKSGIEPAPVSESVSADMMVLHEMGTNHYGEYYCTTGSCVGILPAVAFSPITVLLVVSSDISGILPFFQRYGCSG